MSAATDLPISLRVGNVKAGRASRGDAVWLGLDALMLSGLVGLDGLVPDAFWLDDFELEEGIKRLQATGRSATFIVRATMSEEREDVVQPVACQSRGKYRQGFVGIRAVVS